MKLLACLLLTLCVGCAEPITDEQVKTMVAHCEKIGQRVYVFNGATSYVKCTTYH